jgi:uncharacterized protein (TIGR02646 family)
MRHIQRLPLSSRSLELLQRRTLAVRAAADPKSEASRLWRLRKNLAFAEIRKTLDQMATGRRRCMYCEDSLGTDLEHFWPRATYPERAFVWENLLLACSHCNSNGKRSRFPLDASDRPLLLDPTRDEPLDHLLFSETGRYKHRSRKGKTSIQVFDLNRIPLAEGRRDAWIAIPELLIRYAQYKAAGRSQQAQDIEQALRRYPFSGVFAAFLRIAESRSARRFLTPECLAVLRSHPEIATWI